MAAPGDTEVLLFSTLSILQIIKEAQQQHGLRHGDYQRYRAYCSRRIRRIRKSLHLTNQHKSVAKHSAKFQVKKVNNEIVKDIKYFLLPLFDAERCWAYGMQLKQEMGEDISRKKFHLINKLRKAIQHTTQMEQLCKTIEQIDPPTKLEVQAYNSWMHGCFYFEMKDWNKAIEAFSTARTIYEKLSTAVTDKSVCDLYLARCHELQPQLRYCAFNIGDQSAIEDLKEMRLKIATGTGDDLLGTDLDRLIAETRDKATSAQKAEVYWFGHQVSLQWPNRVHTFYNTLREFDSQLEAADNFDEKMSLYEKLMIECRDAIQAVKDESKGETLRTKRGSDDVGSSMNDIQLLHSYLNFVRLNRTIDRYIMMVEQAKSPGDGKKPAKAQDLVRLYDTILQNLSELEVLPGVEEDQNFLSESQAKSAYFKTFRCFYVSETYASLKKWPEALALYDRTLEHAGIGKNMLKKSKDFENEMISSKYLDQLINIVNTAKYTAHANRLFEGEKEQTETSVSDKPILEDLDTYRHYNPSDLSAGKVPSLVRMPPDFEPMPCKPLFFDLALNHMTFPNLEDKIESPKERQDQEKGGLTGLVKGWFWGKENK